MRKVTLAAAVILILGAVLINTVAEASGSGVALSPRQIVARYFQLWGEINNLTINISGLDPREGTPVNDSTVIFSAVQADQKTLNAKTLDGLKTVWLNVNTVFSGKIWTFEDVIAKIDNEMQAQGFDVAGFYQKLRSVYETKIEKVFGLDLGYYLGPNPEANSSSDVSSYYHVVKNGTYKATISQNFNQPLREFMIDWYTTSRLMGLISENLQDTLFNANDFLADVSPAGLYSHLADYLDVPGYTIGDWNHTSALLFFAGQYTALTAANMTAGMLISQGYGLLVSQLEAMLGKNLFQKDVNKNVIVNETVNAQDALTLLNTRMMISDNFLGVLGAYFGRALSKNDPLDAGIIGGAIDGVFGRLREENYNPVTKTWTNTGYTLDNAIAEQQELYEIAVQIRAPIERAMGISLNIGDLNTGAADRVFLEDAARKVQALEKYGLSHDQAMNAFSQMIDFSPGAKGEQLKNTLISFYQIDNPSQGDIDFNDSYQRSAFLGLIDLVSVVLSRPAYFGISRGDFEGAFARANDIFSNATAQDLRGMLCTAYNTGGKWNISEGLYAGSYTYWAQVLAAKDRDVVQQQLNARTQIYNALQRQTGGLIDATEKDSFAIVLEFEKKLGGDLSGLSDILGAIKSLKGNLTNLNDVLETIKDPTPESQEWLYPQNPEVAGVLDLDHSFGIVPMSPVESGVTDIGSLFL